MEKELKDIFFLEETKDKHMARKSLMIGANNKKHICETLRLIYDEVYELPDSESKDAMTELLVEALLMAKKMQNRLSYYQKTYKDNTGNKAINIFRIPGSVSRSKKRRLRTV